MFERVWNSKLFHIVVTSIISICMVILAYGLRANYENNVTLQAEFDKRPTKDEVNLKFEEVDKKIDKVDSRRAEDRAYTDAQIIQITKYFEQYIRQTQETSQAHLELTKSVDGNVKILMNRH